jgi:hypothetical protein
VTTSQRGSLRLADRTDSMACLMATLFSRSSSAKYFFATSQSSSASDTGTMTIATMLMGF